jgi:small subunit ribosomal protein S6
MPTDWLPWPGNTNAVVTMDSLKGLKGHAGLISVKLIATEHQENRRFSVPGGGCAAAKIAYKRGLRRFRPGAERMAAKSGRAIARHPVSPPSRSFEPFPRLGGLGAETAIEQERATMPLYEHVFLARQDVTAQQVEELSAEYRGIIEKNGGKIVGEPEYWGMKSLTFRIKKNRKAHFAMLRLDAPPAAVTEMERLEGISEDVIRFLTVRVDAHDEGPSIMLQKRDRDERRGDRRRDRDGEEFESTGPAVTEESAS